jgi:hypothetical protein
VWLCCCDSKQYTSVPVLKCLKLLAAVKTFETSCIYGSHKQSPQMFFVASNIYM